MDIESDKIDTECEGYIVPDGYLSENEMGYDKDGIYSFKCPYFKE